MTELLIAGLGYTGRAIAAAATREGLRVTVLSRDSAGAVPPGCRGVAFADAARALADAEGLVITAPPDTAGDPVLARHGAALTRAGGLRWIGYLSSTGVYGDRSGGTVTEATEPRPTSARGRLRRAAECGWAALARAGAGADGLAVDLIRLAGIYGPGRSALDDVRAGRAKPIRAPGHAFGRIHLDDIAAGVLAARRTADPALCPVRVLNFNDREPAPSADVIREAAMLLGVALPPERSLEEAWPTMSPMARSFWTDNRRVSSAATERALGRPWRHPTYREGLRAVLRAEQDGERVGEERDVGRA